MATTIAKASIQLSANAAEVMSELEKVQKKSKALEGAVKGIPEVGEKITASFGRVGMVSKAFEELTSDADFMTKGITAVETSVASMTTGFQLATKVASGLKAALIGTGIGLAVVGLGALVNLFSRTTEAAAEWERRRSSLSSGARDFLEGADRGIVDRERRFITHRGAMVTGSRVERDLTPEVAAIGEMASSLRDMRRGWEDTTTHVGRSREEIRLMEAETRALASIDTPVFRAFREEVERARAAFDASRLTTFIGGISSATDRIRDSAATMGMSTEAAEMYRLSLRTTTRMIDGVRVATTESLSPIEAHRRRVDEAREALRRGEIDISRYTERTHDSARAMRIEEVALRDLTRTMESAGRRRAELAARTEAAGIADSVRSPLDRIRDSVRPIERAFRAGRIDVATYHRALGGVAREFDRLGGMELPTGPRALLEGSAEAVSAINAARRAGGDSPGERAVRILDVIRRSGEETERHGRDLLRLMSGGILRL